MNYIEEVILKSSLLPGSVKNATENTLNTSFKLKESFLVSWVAGISQQSTLDCSLRAGSFYVCLVVSLSPSLSPPLSFLSLPVS